MSWVQRVRSGERKKGPEWQLDMTAARSNKL